MYQDFDALSLMQQAPANFMSEAAMPVTSFGQGLGNFDLAGAYMPFVQPSMTPRFGVGGMMTQPDNSGSLPGETTTLPASPEQPKPLTATQATDPFSTGQSGTLTEFEKRLLDMIEKRPALEREYQKEDLQTIREMAREANTMGQWNTILAAGLKLPDRINDAFARRNMYLDDMLRSTADAAREQAAGIRQTTMSNPGANIPARNYIRI